MASPETLQSEAFWAADRPHVLHTYRASAARADRVPFVRAILEHTPESVLDVGCHCGPLLDVLRLNGYPGYYVGVDVNAGAIADAQSRNPAFAEFHQINARAFLTGTPTDHFDVVCCSSVLSHMAPDDAQAVLAEMLRVAKTAVVIQEPTDRDCAEIPSWNHPYADWFDALWEEVDCRAYGVYVWRRHGKVDELGEEILQIPTVDESHVVPFHVKHADPPLRSKKIAIVGFAPSTRDLAPYGDPSFEIWGQNHFAFFQARCDRIFELHDEVTIRSESESGEAGRAKNVRDTTGYLDKLRGERERPIYMLEHREDIPASLRFPVDRVTAFFGEYCAKLQTQPYITSSFGHMIGYAILKLLEARTHRWVPEGEELHIYGVDLLSDEEYAYQRANAEFFGGYCIGAGIRLYIPEQSAIFSNAGVYGYCDDDSTERVSRIMHHLIKRRVLMLGELTQFEQAAQQANRNVHSAQSQLHEIEKILAWLEMIMRGGVIERPWGSQ